MLYHHILLSSPVNILSPLRWKHCQSEAPDCCPCDFKAVCSVETSAFLPCLEIWFPCPNLLPLPKAAVAQWWSVPGHSMQGFHPRSTAGRDSDQSASAGFGKVQIPSLWHVVCVLLSGQRLLQILPHSNKHQVKEAVPRGPTSTASQQCWRPKSVNSTSIEAQISAQSGWPQTIARSSKLTKVRLW